MEKFLYEKVNKFRGKDYHVRFYRVSHCPICGKNRQRCMRVETNGVTSAYWCKYVPSNKPVDTAIGTCYIHDEQSVIEDRKIISIDTPMESIEITPEILELRDRVYRRYRELVKKYNGSYLYSDDLQNLKDRGLSEEQILKNGYFSIPRTNKVWRNNIQMQSCTAIMQTLAEEFGAETLLKVPGFIKKKNKGTGDEYITIPRVKKDRVSNEFIEIKGYYAPYTNYSTGEWNALQYRLTTPIKNEDGKKMRWFWFSSKTASSGSPTSYYIPSNLKRTDVILLTEGALKGQIAAEKMGFEGLFEAGVGNYRRLVKELCDLEELTGTKYKVILALDMDKYTVKDKGGRYPVLEAETKTVNLLKASGHQVAICEWDINKAKGIDDAVVQGLKFQYKLI